jgi:uncharacterized protein YdaU (DUF1376 family)
MGLMKWYKRDPNAALQGMMGLSLEERGAYNTILDLIYTSENRLHDDERFMCAWLRCDVRVWKRLRAALIVAGKITIEDGFIRNLRATSEIDECVSWLQECASNGVKSGISRRKNKRLNEAPLEPSTTTSTSTTIIPPIAPQGGREGNSGAMKRGRKQGYSNRESFAQAVEYIDSRRNIGSQEGSTDDPVVLSRLRESAA